MLNEGNLRWVGPSLRSGTLAMLICLILVQCGFRPSVETRWVIPLCLFRVLILIELLQ